MALLVTNLFLVVKFTLKTIILFQYYLREFFLKNRFHNDCAALLRSAQFHNNLGKFNFVSNKSLMVYKSIYLKQTVNTSASI